MAQPEMTVVFRHSDEFHCNQCAEYMYCLRPLIPQTNTLSSRGQCWNCQLNGFYCRQSQPSFQYVDPHNITFTVEPTFQNMDVDIPNDSPPSTSTSVPNLSPSSSKEPSSSGGRPVERKPCDYCSAHHRECKKENNNLSCELCRKKNKKCSTTRHRKRGEACASCKEKKLGCRGGVPCVACTELGKICEQNSSTTSNHPQKRSDHNDGDDGDNDGGGDNDDDNDCGDHDYDDRNNDSGDKGRGKSNEKGKGKGTEYREFNRSGPSSSSSNQMKASTSPNIPANNPGSLVSISTGSSSFDGTKFEPYTIRMSSNTPSDNPGSPESSSAKSGSMNFSDSCTTVDDSGDGEKGIEYRRSGPSLSNSNQMKTSASPKIPANNTDSLVSISTSSSGMELETIRMSSNAADNPGPPESSSAKSGSMNSSDSSTTVTKKLEPNAAQNITQNEDIKSKKRFKGLFKIFKKKI